MASSFDEFLNTACKVVKIKQTQQRKNPVFEHVFDADYPQAQKKHLTTKSFSQ